MNERIIRSFGGKIIAKIESDDNGNRTVKDFYGKVLGTYDAKQNVTKDFYGRIVAQGDASGMLIPKE